jgi:hypothetical protein
MLGPSLLQLAFSNCELVRTLLGFDGIGIMMELAWPENFKMWSRVWTRLSAYPTSRTLRHMVPVGWNFPLIAYSFSLCTSAKWMWLLHVIP